MTASTQTRHLLKVDAFNLEISFEGTLQATVGRMSTKRWALCQHQGHSYERADPLPTPWAWRPDRSRRCSKQPATVCASLWLNSHTRTHRQRKWRCGPAREPSGAHMDVPGLF